MSVAEAGSQQRAASAGDQEAGEPAAGQSFLVTLVVLTFVMNMLARGVTETFAVFLLPVQNGLGISRADITLTYSVYMLAYGLSAPFAGQLIDRLGARITYGFGLTMLGLGYVLAGSATELWHYLLTVGLLGGLGSASLGMIVASALLSRWFTARIGAVVAVCRCRAGMLIPPPLTQLLLSTYDWRTTHRLLGAGVPLALPLCDAAAARSHDGRLDAWQALRLRAASEARPVDRLDGGAQSGLLGACSRPICSPRLRPTACCRTRWPISSSRASTR
jgi:MFS family permease